MGECFTSNSVGIGRETRIQSEAKGSVNKVNIMKLTASECEPKKKKTQSDYLTTSSQGVTEVLR